MVFISLAVAVRDVDGRGCALSPRLGPVQRVRIVGNFSVGRSRSSGQLEAARRKPTSKVLPKLCSFATVNFAAAAAMIDVQVGETWILGFAIISTFFAAAPARRRPLRSRRSSSAGRGRGRSACGGGDRRQRDKLGHDIRVGGPWRSMDSATKERLLVW